MLQILMGQKKSHRKYDKNNNLISYKDKEKEWSITIS